MSVAAMSALSPAQRSVFRALADVLIPAYGKMPAASEVGVHDTLADEVLKHRPDIRDDLFRALERAKGMDSTAAANNLLRNDAAAFNALGLAASGAYYMSPVVRDLLGYPGQEEVKYDAHETPGYLLDGSIERVLARGRMYRPTPR
ncbi:MAG: hypothetical protein ACREFP_07560 [Acetobacteraceae bacterium]